MDNVFKSHSHFKKNFKHNTLSWQSTILSNDYKQLYMDYSSSRP